MEEEARLEEEAQAAKVAAKRLAMKKMEEEVIRVRVRG